MIVLCVGTRPDIIKTAPVVHALKKIGMKVRIWNAGQHTRSDMSQGFFDSLKLDQADIDRLDIKQTTNSAEVFAHVKGQVEAKLKNTSHVQLVCVYGDVLTALSCGLAAKAASCPLAHIEAGYRSRDLTMPEEMTRMTLDSISDLMFAPTEIQKENLERENVKGKVIVSGNTVVDAVAIGMKALNGDKSVSHVEGYILATLHRPENVDDVLRLKLIMEELSFMKNDVYFPVHPRTFNRLRDFKIPIAKNVHVVDPAGYAEFMRLMINAEAVITDSGGVQEETAILKKPCVVVRKNTERVELFKSPFHRMIDIATCYVGALNDNIQIAKDGMKFAEIYQHPYGKHVGQLIANEMWYYTGGNKV